MFKRLKYWWQHLRLFVILDSADSSITLSRALVREIRRSEAADADSIFVFRTSAPDRCYAFMPDPPIDQPTQLSTLQYNTRYKCVGFETLCPTAARILYDYGVTTDRCRLSITPVVNSDGRRYYRIEPPTKTVSIAHE